MIGHGGDKLGTVQDVLFDEGELVGIVVRPVGFFKHDVVVQVRFLDRSDDMALFLRMTREDVAKLAEFEAPPTPCGSERQRPMKPVSRGCQNPIRSSPSRQHR